MLADFLWLGFMSFYNLASTKLNAGDHAHIYMFVRHNVAIPGWTSRAQKKSCNGETHATKISGIAWLQSSLACRANSSISPFRLALHIPRLQSLAASPSETIHITYFGDYANLIFPSSLTRILPSATKPLAQDTSPTSHDGTTVDAVEIFSVTCIPSIQFP
jgi:hypothetical protein